MVGFVKNRFVVAALALVMVPSVLLAQAFDAGSNGTFGPINVTSGVQTITLPDDGVIHATTITVAAAAQLRFICNARNTPIYLLASGNVTIGGTVFASAPPPTTVSVDTSPGGCGGFAGGTPRIVGTPAGDGYGPGGGRAGDGTVTVPAGSGGFGSAVAGSTAHGAAYGSNLLVPLVGGSGGGGATTQGGGGGGALVIASNTVISLTNSGRVYACGGSYAGPVTGYGHAGSGGAIRLIAPRVDGSGRLDASGSAASSNPACNFRSNSTGNTAAGSGRVRVDTIDRSDFQVVMNENVGPRALGSLMQVFPPGIPELHLVNIAGTNIPVGAGPVNVILPFGAAAQQSVTLRGLGFSGNVPVRLVFTPDSGPRIVVDGTLAMDGQASADVVLSADIPANVRLNVAAWVRDN